MADRQHGQTPTALRTRETEREQDNHPETVPVSISATPPASGPDSGLERVTLSTGVVLTIGQPSVHAATEIARQVEAKRPEPPLRWDEDRGRDVLDEADPAYVRALRLLEVELVDRLFAAGVMLGTTVEHVPAGIPPVEDDAWRDALDLLGIAPPASPSARYLLWVKYVAAPSGEDFAALLLPLLGRFGMRLPDALAASALHRSAGADTGADDEANELGHEQQRSV